VTRPKFTAAANAAAQHLQGIKMKAEQDMMAKATKVDVRTLILHANGGKKMTLMEPAAIFDECIVGTAESNDEVVVAYNKMAVIAALAALDKTTMEEAFDRFTTAYLSMREEKASDATLPQLPVFIVDLRDFVA
jgi:hypothetical protein